MSPEQPFMVWPILRRTWYFTSMLQSRHGRSEDFSIFENQSCHWQITSELWQFSTIYLTEFVLDKYFSGLRSYFFYGSWQLALKLFTKANENDWGCKCRKNLIQKRRTGWSNLMSHIKSQHSENQTSEIQSSVTNLVSTGTTFSRSARSSFGWIEWICVDLLPFSFVEER